MQPSCQVQSPSAPNEPSESTDVKIVLKSQDFYDDSVTLIGAQDRVSLFLVYETQVLFPLYKKRTSGNPKFLIHA